MSRQVFLLTSVAPLLLSIAYAQGTVVISEPATTVTCTRFHQTGFWDVDIQNWPALPKECGPPLSYNAIRDKSKLPAQIIGIVGSYIFFLVATGTLLLTWGRKMRRQAENATGQLKEIEMVNASKYGLSSPAPSSKSWRPFKGLKRQSSTNSKLSQGDSIVSPISPGVESMHSFDPRVLQAQRESSQAEMDKLYAAVLQHEEAKRSQSRVLSSAPSMNSLRSGPDAITSNPPRHPSIAVSTMSSSTLTNDKPKNLRVQIQEVPAEIPRSPGAWSYNSAPKSPYKPVNPPSYPKSPGGFSYMSGAPITPMTPFSPGMQRIELPNDMYPASPPPKNVRMQLPPPKSSGQESGSSTKSKKLIKNLRIGAQGLDADAEDRLPLTPTIPQNPPPPPALPGYEEPLTTATVDSETYASERLDEPRPLPSSQPSRPIPPPLSLPQSPKASKPTAGGALPLRQFQNQVSFAENPLSPGPIKQTILERKPDKVRAGPMTGRTPRTGVPMTPYTPYMPFTPITPCTPGLVSRKERKERIKAEGKKVLLEEDEVKDENDMWDGGY